MRHNYLILYIVVASLFAGALQSCDDDYFRGEGGTKVTITATTAFSNTTSRAVYEDGVNFTADDIDIDNYCFLLFDSDKKFVRAIDVAPGDLPYSVEIERPVVGGNNYHAFLLGNVDAATLGAISEIDDLKKCAFEINRTYNHPKENEKNKFTWSGYLPFTQSTQSLEFVLNPNVAKITATITNSSNDCRIRSVRVKNVVNKVRYAQNALVKSSDFLIEDNAEGDVDYIDYDMEDTLDIGKGGQAKISWYVPHNQAGNNGDRFSNAPPTATYLQIDAVSTVDGVKDNNVATCYKVYPGIKTNDGQKYEDMTDFNVIADHIYNLDVTISGDGVSYDVSNGWFKPDNNLATNIIKLPKNSNCYMIHPIGDRIADVTVYELPIDRINQYWKTVAKEDGTADSHHALTADSKWQVEVIWQDIAGKRAITFCDEYGGALTDVAPGEGLNPFCFKLETDNNGDPVYGNVLVGIKKLKSDGTELDGYCWSWHLWITDYNPDAAPAHSGNTMYAAGGDIDKQGQIYAPDDKSFSSTADVVETYSVSANDGNVQHYQSLYHWYWTTHKESANVWDASGIYANKWIMDRNIGAMSPCVHAIKDPLESFGMYYQYGRKDPFSYKLIYDITGTEKIYSYQTPGPDSPQWEIIDAVATSVGEGVKYPNYYYAKKAKGSDVSWVADPIQNPWYSPEEDPLEPNYSTCEKTLFDPCPAGWRIPSVNAFYFGTYDYVKGSVPSGYTCADAPSFNEEKDYGYAKYYAPELLSTHHPSDTWAHACVTVHVDVNGSYNSAYSMGDYFKDLDKTQNTGYNSTLDSYRERERMFATLYSTGYVGGAYKALKSIFPMQGRISSAGSEGLSGKLGSFSLNLSTLHDSQSGVRWPNFYCSGEQACLWTYENVGDGSASDKYQASLILIQPGTLDNRIYPRQEKLNGRLFMRFHGMLSYKTYLGSRGQNIRCIQE